ncbi:MAG: hypothetical protein M1814_004753 [Vezdaea aestivalis]|nr:MAG: hypothetical protein M1814_004753 [Vezdaea aestivalis]
MVQDDAAHLEAGNLCLQPYGQLHSKTSRKGFWVLSSASFGEVTVQDLKDKDLATALPPTFLAPSLLFAASSRRFGSSPIYASHIGSNPLTLPPDVEFKVSNLNSAREWTGLGASTRNAEVKGPLGTLSLSFPAYMEIEHDEGKRQLKLSVENQKERKQREMWGTTRAYLANYILGVSEGHTAILGLVGVGYRATVEPTSTTMIAEYPGQQFVSLKIGFTHPIDLGIPRGVKATVPQPTRILLEGIDKEGLNQFAAEIRRWRKPEPYKGKGIFVNGETIRLKNKKIK